MNGEREVGRVKMFDPDKGFGFIEWRGGKDVYVNINEVKKAGLGTLHEGDRVSFTVDKTPRGPRAINLALAGEDASQPSPRESAVAGSDTTTNFQFGLGYLEEGYFIRKDGKDYLRAEDLDGLAMEIAKLLGNTGMKPHQIRRFFNKARGIEAKLDRDKDFEAIKADIYSLKRDVAYQVGRRVVPDEFQQFIDRNVELAVQSEANFRQGFLSHFESVLAYFVYFFRE